MHKKEETPHIQDFNIKNGNSSSIAEKQEKVTILADQDIRRNTGKKEKHHTNLNETINNSDRAIPRQIIQGNFR
ncbi:unnamed protein product [Phytomonas sp. Hart1]|nr:unnamed protein product [Phytomonas sp. Hart1]|eukprot:CCW66418.1 unnamed protein product [Phytomonas sp. isolate Hart1]